MAMTGTGAGTTVFELSHPIDHGRKSFHRSVPFLHCYSGVFGDVRRGEDITVASDVITSGLHNGTHIDAFGHVATILGEREFDSRGGPGEVLPVLWTRAALLDFEEVCDGPAYQITLDDLAAVEDKRGWKVGRGEVALVRTGWEKMWGNDDEFGGAEARPPGISLAVAEELGARGLLAIGTDTPTLETVTTQMSVHRALLVKAGVYIIESLRLNELAAADPDFVTFIGLPLVMPGATASPIRALAVAGSDATVAGVAEALFTAGGPAR